MESGWIKLHRSLLKWEWHDDPNTFCLWVHLLLMANHDEQKWHGMVIPRGSLLTGRKKLAEETGLTEQSVRTSLIKLEKSQNLTNKSTNKFTLITICNYDTYQDTPTDYQPTNQPTTNQQLTTNKNIKNVRIEESKNNISSSSPARAREEELALGGVIGEVDSLAEELKEEIQNGGSTAESALRLYGLNPQQTEEYVGWFVDKLRLDGTTFKSRSDFRRHFANWLRIQVEQSLKRQQSNGTKYSSRNENPADLFTELG